MDFNRDFKIIAKQEVSVTEGLDFPIGNGRFGMAFLVKEKNGPWNSR